MSVPSILSVKATCLLNLKRWEEVATASTQAIERDDTVAEFFLFRGYAEVECGLLEEALKDGLKAFGLDRKDERSVELVRRIAELSAPQKSPDEEQSEQ